MERRASLFLALAFLIGALSSCRSITISDSDKSRFSDSSINTHKPFQEEIDFIDKHWQLPLRPQGPFPNSQNYHGITLEPKSCGTCHVEQFASWKVSLHGKAMRSGVIGQLLEKNPGAVNDHQDCLRCHAPLAEQAESLSKSLAKRISTGLHQQGVICAACHLREGVWYGPPRRDGSSIEGEVAKSLPHGAWKSSPEFENSRFCASCHQFKPGERDLNGKLLENTFNEWQASRFSREGISCQNCHMPERRHLWRGIHDPAMVKSGVEISTERPKESGGWLTASLSLTSRNVGHLFPTYITPQVFLEVVQLDRKGREIKNSLKSLKIGRDVSVGLKEEFADTRLAPGDSAILQYREKRNSKARQLLLRVRVEPDEFYTRFYEAWLAQGLAKRGRIAMQQALSESRASAYVLESVKFDLPSIVSN